MGMFNDKINVRGGVEVARNNSAGLHFYSPSPLLFLLHVV